MTWLITRRSQWLTPLHATGLLIMVSPYDCIVIMHQSSVVMFYVKLRNYWESRVHLPPHTGHKPIGSMNVQTKHSEVFSRPL